MKISLTTHTLQTQIINDIIKITPQVEQDIADSGIRNGLVNIMSPHTTAGIVVNEGVECVQRDIHDFLEKLAPVDGSYQHSHYLDRWGGSAANAHTHLKTLMSGIHAYFPIQDEKLVIGSLQSIYFIEFDGPCLRKYTVQILGE